MTPPHTPEHNGLAERRYRHIVETGLALLTHANIPQSYWSYSFAAAVYLINRMPTPTLANSTPFQRLFNVDPNYNKLRTFGCLCYPWLLPYGQTKFSPKSSPCVFLGYSLTQSAYICLDPSTSRIYILRHVVFHESIFPFSQLSCPSVPTSSQEASPNTSPMTSLAPTYSQPVSTPSLPSTDHSPDQSTAPSPLLATHLHKLSNTRQPTRSQPTFTLW